MERREECNDTGKALKKSVNKSQTVSLSHSRKKERKKYKSIGNLHAKILNVFFFFFGSMLPEKAVSVLEVGDDFMASVII